jgi:hypothetical protein
MRVTSQQSTSGVTGTDQNAQSIQDSIDELERLMQAVQQQQQTGVPAGDPTQLSQGITNNLRNLQGPQEAGKLTPEQDSRVQNVLQSLEALMQKSGVQPQQNATGFPADDKYEAKKVGGHHGGGHHKVHAPPVDGSDPDSNTLPTDSGD